MGRNIIRESGVGLGENEHLFIYLFCKALASGGLHKFMYLTEENFFYWQGILGKLEGF